MAAVPLSIISTFRAGRMGRTKMQRTLPEVRLCLPICSHHCLEWPRWEDKGFSFWLLYLRTSKEKRMGVAFIFNFSKRVLLTPKSPVIPGCWSCRCYAWWLEWISQMSSWAASQTGPSRRLIDPPGASQGANSTASWPRGRACLPDHLQLSRPCGELF